jgi:hypothetical protein
MEIKDLYDGKLVDEEKFGLDVLAEKIENGKVILFLGAAVHSPPPKGFEAMYAPGDRPPLGKELAIELTKYLPRNDIVKDKNLSWIAQYYEGFRDRRDLIKKISDVLSQKKPSPIVRALARMNFNLILTTNYDNLYEDALEGLAAPKSIKNKGVYKPNKSNLIPQPTVDFSANEVSGDAPFIYKIHGDIKDVYSPDGRYHSEKDSIVITDEDYIHFILKMGEKDTLGKKNYNPIPSSFTTALADPDDITILFIGYSLMDYNLRLLFKSTMWKKDVQSQLRKWSVDLYPDVSIKNLYEGLYTITFIEKDAWTAIPYLYNRLFGEDMPV